MSENKVTGNPTTGEQVEVRHIELYALNLATMAECYLPPKTSTAQKDSHGWRRCQRATYTTISM